MAETAKQDEGRAAASGDRGVPVERAAGASAHDHPLKGPGGEDTGIVLKVAGRGKQGETNEETAGRIVGWSTYVLDGEEFEYSPHNALALVNRFEYVRSQLRPAPS